MPPPDRVGAGCVGLPRVDETIGHVTPHDVVAQISIEVRDRVE